MRQVLKLADVLSGTDGGSFPGDAAQGPGSQPQEGPQGGLQDGVSWVADGIGVAIHINTLLDNGRSSMEGKEGIAVHQPNYAASFENLLVKYLYSFRRRFTTRGRN